MEINAAHRPVVFVKAFEEHPHPAVLSRHGTMESEMMLCQDEGSRVLVPKLDHSVMEGRQDPWT